MGSVEWEMGNKQMSSRSVEVAAPSRLHFGMFSFGQPGVRQFGGVGAMIATPGVLLKITPAARVEIVAPNDDATVVTTVREHVLNVERAGWSSDEFRCRIEITTLPRRHAGLGSGTQLALALAAGLNAFLGHASKSSTELARAVHRGERSAIGTHGFGRGGLLVEAGKLAANEISPLVSRVDMSPDWRWVLICPESEIGLSGEAERRAFEKLPPVPVETTDRLCRLALLELVPAAITADFTRFSEALYEFGHDAGLCFASQQAGPFASPRVAEIVARVRSLGVLGVAQTSWGPTIAALMPDESAAAALVERLQAASNVGSLDLHVAKPNNHGACVQVVGG